MVAVVVGGAVGGDCYGVAAVPAVATDTDKEVQVWPDD